MWLTAPQFLLGFTQTQNSSPTSRARIAAACAVSEEIYDFSACHLRDIKLDAGAIVGEAAIALLPFLSVIAPRHRGHGLLGTHGAPVGHYQAHAAHTFDGLKDVGTAR